MNMSVHQQQNARIFVLKSDPKFPFNPSASRHEINSGDPSEAVEMCHPSEALE